MLARTHGKSNLTFPVCSTLSWKEFQPENTLQDHNMFSSDQTYFGDEAIFVHLQKIRMYVKSNMPLITTSYEFTDYLMNNPPMMMLMNAYGC